MKKSYIIIIFLIIVIIAVYGIIAFQNNKKDLNTNENINNITDIKEETLEDIWEDNNPIIVGMYEENNISNKMSLIRENSYSWKYHKDITILATLFTNEEYIAITNYPDMYKKYSQNYENIEKYRIGYIVNFKTEEEEISKQILRPADTESFYDYLEIYLYDPIFHQNDSWYSHTTDDEYNSDTLLGAIKLTAGIKIDEIKSDIMLTVFTYDDDDFDDNNIYKGISKYTAIIRRN